MDPNIDLLIAVAEDNVAAVDEAIAAGADINHTNQHAMAAIHIAAAGTGSLAMTQHLLSHGANVNMADFQGWTPLMNAASCGRDAVIEALIGAGAAVDAVNTAGWTALSRAAARGHATSVQLLLAAGAAVHHTVNGATAAQLAQSAGHAEVVALVSSS